METGRYSKCKGAERGDSSEIYYLLYFLMALLYHTPTVVRLIVVFLYLHSPPIDRTAATGGRSRLNFIKLWIRV